MLLFCKCFNIMHYLVFIKREAIKVPPVKWCCSFTLYFYQLSVVLPIRFHREKIKNVPWRESFKLFKKYFLCIAAIFRDCIWM